MLFSSLTFLFFFFPGVIGIYLVLPKAWRIRFLLAASLVFYGWADVRYVFLMVFEILISWMIGRQIAKSENPKRKYWLTAGCLIIVGLLIVFKYTDFLISFLNMMLPKPLGLLNIILPVGISFYTFQILSYLADIYSGKELPESSLMAYACYISLFCQLIAGPIVRLSQIRESLHNPETGWDQVYSGLLMFVCGLCKKVLLANQLYGFCQMYLTAVHPSAVYAWMFALCNVLYIYFDFSGYSDMAIGLGKMLGFHFPANFNYPFTAGSVTEFWRRWHMSLTSWFKDYVYIPLGGSRVSGKRLALNLLAVWILTGLWHGAAWNFVWWGLYFCGWILMEKLYPVRCRFWKPVRAVYTWVVVLIGFALFSLPSLDGFLTWIQCAFGMGSVFADAFSMYQIRNAAVLIVVSLIGCTKWPASFFRKMQAAEWGSLAAAVLAFAGWVLCLAFITGGSFNPFLYFRF